MPGTGIWSRRMEEANKRQGFVPGGGMVAACVILASVIGLGFRLKLQVAKMFLNDFVQHAYVDRVENARRAAGFKPGVGGRSSTSDFERERERVYERARQQARQQARPGPLSSTSLNGKSIENQ